MTTWLFFSTINQLPASQFGFLQRLRNADRFALLPNWTFFAPDPGIHDYELLYSDQARNGRWTPWRHASLPSRQAPRAIFDPSKRPRKLVTDLCQSLLASEGAQFRLNPLSLEYLWLLWIVETQPADFTAERRRFAIVATVRDVHSLPPEVLLVSPSLNLDRGNS